MAEKFSLYGSQLRFELGQRNRLWAKGRAHVESYGDPPVIVYAPEFSVGEDFSTATIERHGNFFDPAYAAICAQPKWLRRLDKIHAQGKALPKVESGRKWRELDSSMSSDALLMNVFCTPEMTASPIVRRTLGIDDAPLPEFGWKARVPLANGRFDRTEVDMRWGSLLVEAKLTESDFQCREAAVVEGYRDFDLVFDRASLPRVEMRTVRRRQAAEFPEDFSQEPEMIAPDDAALSDRESIALAYQSEIASRAWESAPVTAGYASYQLIRSALAAHAEGCSFCVIHDARRPDLREAWFSVMLAVKSAELRVRLKVLTWQELAALAPVNLREFLENKYGISAPA